MCVRALRRKCGAMLRICLPVGPRPHSWMRRTLTVPLLSVHPTQDSKPHERDLQPLLPPTLPPGGPALFEEAPGNGTSRASTGCGSETRDSPAYLRCAQRGNSKCCQQRAGMLRRNTKNVLQRNVEASLFRIAKSQLKISFKGQRASWRQRGNGMKTTTLRLCYVQCGQQADGTTAWETQALSPPEICRVRTCPLTSSQGEAHARSSSRRTALSL